jgi:hypothetical protein
LYCEKYRKIRNEENVKFYAFSLSLAPTLYRKSDLCIPRKETVGPRSHCLHSFICERFTYSHDQSAYLAAAKLADQSWEYKSLTDIRMPIANWETEHYNSVLEIRRPSSFVSGNTSEPDILYWILNSPLFAMQMYKLYNQVCSKMCKQLFMCHQRVEPNCQLKIYLNAAAALVGSCPEHLHPVLGERRGGRHRVAALVAEIKIKIPHETFIYAVREERIILALFIGGKEGEKLDRQSFNIFISKVSFCNQ